MEKTTSGKKAVLNSTQNFENKINKFHEVSTNDTEIKHTSMRIIYKKLIKMLDKCKFYFNCAECQCLLFTSEDISGIYCLDQTKFCLMIDPESIKYNFKIRKEKEEIVRHEDKELGQSDCLYNNSICGECSCILGRYIYGVSSEKEKLKKRILIFSNKIDAVLLEKFDSVYVNLNDYVEFEQKDNDEIRQFCELNEKLSRCICDITDRMLNLGSYLEIKEYIEESEAFADTLERLAKYVNYLDDTKKRSLI